MSCKRYVGFIIMCVMSLGLVFPLSSAEESWYSETLDVLQAVYANEVIASRTYTAFAKRAQEEGFPEIGALFSALSQSETIHARNFKTVIGELGGVVPEIPISDVNVQGTKENLHHAVSVELSEIGEGYPQFIARVEPEGYTRGVEYLTYAWKAEHQHRDHIAKIHKFGNSFFRAVAKRIKKEGTDYYVCESCGSTLAKSPKKTCPICLCDSAHYVKVSVE